MQKAEIQNKNCKNSFWVKIDERFTRLEQFQLYQKAVLTFDEASQYSGIKKSYLYKLTSRGELPHYKPNGKMIFIDRVEFEAWLLRNRIKPVDELNKEATTYVTLNRKGSKS